ncbi:hypothetical protein Droror1_Dr00006541, partial [Drosera rotundifolia]
MLRVAAARGGNRGSGRRRRGGERKEERRRLRLRRNSCAWEKEKRRRRRWATWNAAHTCEAGFLGGRAPLIDDFRWRRAGSSYWPELGGDAIYCEDEGGRTSNLDGETNLEKRKALKKTWDYLTSEKATKFEGYDEHNERPFKKKHTGEETRRAYTSTFRFFIRYVPGWSYWQ